MNIDMYNACNFYTAIMLVIVYTSHIQQYQREDEQ